MKFVSNILLILLGIYLFVLYWPFEEKANATNFYKKVSQISEISENRLKEDKFKTETDKVDFESELKRFNRALDQFKQQRINRSTDLALLMGILGTIVAFVYCLSSMSIFFHWSWSREFLIAGIIGVVFWFILGWFWIMNWSNFYYSLWLIVGKLSLLGGWEQGDIQKAALIEKNKILQILMMKWFLGILIFTAVPAVLLWQEKKKITSNKNAST